MRGLQEDGDWRRNRAENRRHLGKIRSGHVRESTGATLVKLSVGGIDSELHVNMLIPQGDV